MKENGQEIENKILNDILDAIFNGMDGEKVTEEAAGGSDETNTSGDREIYAECRNPEEHVFVFTPGEVGSLSKEKDCFPIMDMSGEHRVNLYIDPFDTGGYLFSYDDRQIHEACGRRYLTGTVFIIALDDHNKTRNVSSVDVCYLCHLLEPCVGEKICDGTHLLMMDEFYKRIRRHVL